VKHINPFADSTANNRLPNKHSTVSLPFYAR
jgi:hypothetical protein